MQGLSYGVVRVDTPNSLTSLTLQDCGQVLPGGNYHTVLSTYYPTVQASPARRYLPYSIQYLVPAVLSTHSWHTVCGTYM